MQRTTAIPMHGWGGQVAVDGLVGSVASGHSPRHVAYPRSAGMALGNTARTL
jgi:hypothetical protein